MKRFFGFFFLGFLVIAIWLGSSIFMVELYGIPKTASEAGEMFGGVNALFSGLALAGVIFTVWLQSADLKTNEKNLNKSMEANQRSMEIMALSALIQESDCALARYERWESADADYAKAKATVRKKLNEHRKKLELVLDDIENT